MARDVEVIWNDELVKRLEDALSDGEVAVGVMGGEYPDGKSVAEVASYLEFGTVNNPPKPFFRETFDAQKGEWVETYIKALKNGEGSMGGKKAVAKGMVEDIKQDIKGRGLIKTGTLYNSISAEID